MSLDTITCVASHTSNHPTTTTTCHDDNDEYEPNSDGEDLPDSSHKNNCCGQRSPYFGVTIGHNIFDDIESIFTVKMLPYFVVVKYYNSLK